MAKANSTLTKEEQREAARLERAYLIRMALIDRMIRFSGRVKASDCAGLTSTGEPTQYTHLHNSIKRHGGTPPRDYLAVEMLVDFRKALAGLRYDEAMPYYFSLRRMLHLI